MSGAQQFNAPFDAKLNDKYSVTSQKPSTHTEIQIVEREMFVNPRGSPPKATPLDAAMARDVQTRMVLLNTRPLMMTALDKDKVKGIVDATTARQYLEDSQWITKGAVVTKTDLGAMLVKTTLLMQVLQKAMWPTIRAIGFLIEVAGDDMPQQVADMCGVALSEVIDTPFKEMRTAHDGMCDAMKEMKGESSILKEEVEESRKGMEALQTQIQELKAAVETTGKVTAEAVAMAPMRIYTGAVAAAAPALTANQAAVLARQVRMQRQIMLDKADGMTTEGWSTLSNLELLEMGSSCAASPGYLTYPPYLSHSFVYIFGLYPCIPVALCIPRACVPVHRIHFPAAHLCMRLRLSQELKEKAMMALTLMEAKLEGAAFSGAKKLANGGVVFDCRDTKMVQWIKQADHMT
jgi:hypothetical protein